MQLVRYKPAKYGLGTESSLNLQPLDFAPEIVNRFYNLLGDLETRPGIAELGAGVLQSTQSSAQVTNIHEYVDSSGNATLFASGIERGNSTNNGRIWRYNTSANTTISAWQEVWPANLTTFAPPVTLYSSQMNDKLIFCNGQTRNFYIGAPQSDPDGDFVSAGYTQQLYSAITKGTTGSGTTPTLLFDNDISNWKTQTNVATNDLVLVGNPADFFLTAGIVTSVGTSSLDVTNISTSGKCLGLSNSALASGMPYRIVDLVELNIIPQVTTGVNPGSPIYDNVAVAGAATNSTVISVTALDFSTTSIRPGDYIYNTTRAAVCVVTTVTANLNISAFIATGITGQVAGDSLVFLKDAMPIATYPHVHYGQLYLIDARDQTKIRVSGPNDPEDFTTFSKTLQSSTLDYGSRQSKGDILLTMGTFQRYFVVGGKQNLYVIDGTVPIAEVTADVIDLQPVGLMPQGVVSPRGFANIGNEMLYLARDGLRSFLAAYSSNNTTTSNKSEQIKSQIIADIQTLIDSPDQLQLAHYPRRNWVFIKIGSNVYNYNYTPIYQPGTSILQQASYTTITQFGGVMNNITAFLVRRNGDLILGSNDGKVYVFDNGAVNDTGQAISTRYVSPWHTLQEGQSDLTLLKKDIRYIKPVFESFGNVEYNIDVVGSYDRLSNDSTIVTAAGAVVVGQSQVGNCVIGNTAITDPKVSLRSRGEQFQLTIETSSLSGGDIINSYTIYGNVFGRR